MPPPTEESATPTPEPTDSHQHMPPPPPAVAAIDYAVAAEDEAMRQQITFFDGANDGSGLTQDLDWLFNASPWDMSAGLFGAAQDGNGDHRTATDSQQDLSPGGSAATVVTPAGQSEQQQQQKVPRERVMEVLTTVPGDVLNSTFFEDANLDMFMRNYWECYNPHFQLLHRPTFSVQEAPPLLLVALLTLGATLSPDEAHYQVAEQVHQTLRWLIFTSPSFETPAPLWVIQALLVVQAHEKMFSSRRMHEMSHIFHYSVITLMRRGSCYYHHPPHHSSSSSSSAAAAATADRNADDEHVHQQQQHASSSSSSSSSSLEKKWHRWAERELTHRAAYFAFIMDAQHSSIFGHTPMLSLTDIRLPLPCAEAVWDAPTAAAWAREQRLVQQGQGQGRGQGQCRHGGKQQSPPSFLSALRALLSRHPIPHSYSCYARFVLLHGLFSLTRHMITRDQMAAASLDPSSSSSSSSVGGGGGGGGGDGARQHSTNNSQKGRQQEQGGRGKGHGEGASAAAAAAASRGGRDQQQDGQHNNNNNNNNNNNWRDRLDRAIDTWSLSLLHQTPSLCLEAARPLQRIAHVSIHVSLLDFHVLAGAPNLATSSSSSVAQSQRRGREGGGRGGRGGGGEDAQFARAYERVCAWASGGGERDGDGGGGKGGGSSSSSGMAAVKRTLSHCLLLIQETMFTRTRYVARDDNIILRPWVLYHTTLVVWAYGAITEGVRQHKTANTAATAAQTSLSSSSSSSSTPSSSRHGEAEEGEEDEYTAEPADGDDTWWSAEDYLSHMLNGLMGEGDPAQLRGTNRTGGLLAAVRTALEGCRWELLQEAKETLDRLPEQQTRLLAAEARRREERRRRGETGSGDGGGGSGAGGVGRVGGGEEEAEEQEDDEMRDD